MTTRAGSRHDYLADPDAAPAARAGSTTDVLEHLLYVAAGIFLGILFVKSEVLSWYRIQEMFLFRSFHMYGIIGSALVVAASSIWAIRRLGLRTLGGAEIVIPEKRMSRVGYRYWMGGAIFGLGWALLGACPGPIFALIGSGATVLSVALLSALAGTWTYGAVMRWMPH